MRLSCRATSRLLTLVALVSLALALPTAGFSQVSKQKKDEALSLLKDMIPYRTAKGYGQLPALVDHLTSILREAGFPEEDIIEVPLNIDGEDVSGLIVRYRALSDSPELDPVVF